MNDLVPVRFTKAHALYNAGETAGFSADKVEELRRLEVIEKGEPVEVRFAQSGGQTAEALAGPATTKAAAKPKPASKPA